MRLNVNGQDIDVTLEDEKGFCAVATLQDIEKQDFILTPGR